MSIIARLLSNIVLVYLYLKISIIFAKNLIMESFCFIMITVKDFWCHGLEKNLLRQASRRSKNFIRIQRNNGQLSTRSGLLLQYEGWSRFIYVKQSERKAKTHPSDENMGKLKEHCTGVPKNSSFYWDLKVWVWSVLENYQRMDYAAPIPHVFRLESPRLTPFTIQ
jgi:hypothetical protein